MLFLFLHVFSFILYVMLMKVMHSVTTYRNVTSIFVSAGSQLTVCEKSCHVVITVRNRCQSQFTSINENRSADLLDYISNFNCSSPETYLIPGFPLNTQRCIPADDLCEFFMHAMSNILISNHVYHLISYVQLPFIMTHLQSHVSFWCLNLKALIFGVPTCL